MRELNFTIYQIPTGKATVQHTRSGIAYHTKRQQFNADSLMTEMLQYRPSEPITNPIQLFVWVYFPVPKSKPNWWKEAAISNWIAYDKKPDDDNCRKQIADCLEKLQFIKNDSQIYHSEIYKFYGTKPRWEIRIIIMPNITRRKWEMMKGEKK